MQKIFFILLFFYSSLAYSQTIFNEEIPWDKNNNNPPLLKNSDSLIIRYSGVIKLKGFNPRKLNYIVVLQNISAVNFSSDDLDLPQDIDFEYSIFNGRGKIYLYYSLNILTKTKKINSFSIKISSKKQKNKCKQNFVSNSVLRSGKWIKIAITKDGVYRISYDRLKQLGFSDPSKVRIFGNDEGQLPEQNDIQVPDDLIENYVFYGDSYLLFYAEGADKWYYDTDDDFFYLKKNIYTDTAYYFLTDYNTGFNNSIPYSSSPSTTTTATITDFTYLYHYEQNINNLLESGQIWLGENFRFTPTQSFSSDQSLVAGKNAKIRFVAAVRSPVVSSMTYNFDNQSKTENFGVYYDIPYTQYVDYKTVTYDFVQSGNPLTVSITYNSPVASANAWLDYCTFNGIAPLSFSEQMIFRNKQNIGDDKVSEFVLSDANNSVVVWDITEPTRPKRLQTSLNGGALYFKDNSDTIRTYIAFTVANCPEPVYNGTMTGEVANQNLHNTPTTTDMIIVSPPEFFNQARQIADFHAEHDNLNCIAVTTDQVYNEFSSGMPDATAIKNYCRMVYQKTGGRLKYLLLLGDGTYKNFGKRTKYNPTWIPTYQSKNSFNTDGLTVVSDDYFGLLDDNEGELDGALDIAVARFPAKSAVEAQVLVDKLHLYYNNENFGNWQNIITLLADDRDGVSALFTYDAEDIAEDIDTNFKSLNIKKIYLDAYKQEISAVGEEYPQAVVDLNNRINAGNLILSFLGHGNTKILTAEKVVSPNEINKWNNSSKLMLMMAGTCLFARFDLMSVSEDLTSSGEKVLIKPDGGAIIMFGTARVSYASVNLLFSKLFLNELLGNNLTVGEAYRVSKNQLSSDAKYTYTLLGDPAVKIKYPVNKVVLTKINGTEISAFTDTIRALDKITIEGIVTSDSDEFLSDFNGVVNITLFDKKKTFQTLNNDGAGAMTYWSQFNKLFSGNATVSNGRFSAEFIIPKDIYYNYGKAKFSFFADNQKIDATGYNKSITLGGINDSAPVDNTGPVIRLFLNDTMFVSGGITDSNPEIYAILQDNSGINISSAAIGHDIIASIDDDPNQIYKLNDYYTAENDNYSKGIVKYNLYNLTEGKHTLKLRAWDVYNNMSETEIKFVVISDNKLIIRRLYNYPNPFTTHTDFYFEHNMPGVEMDVLLQIFSVSGKIVKTIHQKIISDGYRCGPFSWDGLDDFGKPIGKGAYLYRLKIRTNTGFSAEKYEKLLILN